VPNQGVLEPLPPGSVLLHIGPHKTGTTALQGAFHISRDALDANGVHYAGRNRQPMLAALAVTGRPGRKGDPSAQPKHWEALQDEVAAYRGRQRVVISSEFFADALDDAARITVEKLGGPDVHVVLTLRPLVRIMPSQWQQYVQNGMRMDYQDWLDHMLRKPPYEEPSPTFWNRHDHLRLMKRWVAAAGPKNVTVIAVDDSDRTMLMRTFEQLLALPERTLLPEEGIANRSLSLPEVELIRLLNIEFKRHKWSNALYGRVVRNGIAKPLQATREPASEEPRIVTPRWAQERAAAIGKQMAGEIASSGVRVVGDLEALYRLPPATAEEELGADPVLALPAEAAAMAVVNAIAAAKREHKLAAATGLEPVPPAKDMEDRTVGSVSTSSLLRVMARRVRRRLQIRRAGQRGSRLRGRAS
jgi:hypothetical protein